MSDAILENGREHIRRTLQDAKDVMLVARSEKIPETEVADHAALAVSMIAMRLQNQNAQAILDAIARVEAYLARIAAK